MKINREQLVELLVDKTGMQQDQVEEQLAELINRIHEASDEGKKFEIKEFGTFSMQEGQLQFTPSDKLKTEINNKYAGMEPIELIGSYQDADEDEPQKDKIEVQEEQEEPEPVADFEGESEEDEASDQEPSEPEDEEEPEEIEALEVQEEADPFAGLEEESEDEEDEVPESEEQEPEPEEVESEREGIIWGLDEEADDEEEDEELKEFERKVAEALNQGTEVTESEETTEPVEEEPPEPEDEEELEEIETREQKEEEADPFAGLEEESEDEEAEAPEPVTAKPQKDLRNIGHRRDRKNSSTMTILVAAASIIIIAISVWLAYDLGVFTDSGSDSTNGDGGETEQQVASATQQNNLPAASPDESSQPDNQQTGANTETPEGQADQQQAESGAQQQTEPDTENEVANEGDDESASSVYGLKGSLTPAGNDGYTLIVLSMRYEDRSREVYRDLKQQGYRALIVSAMVNGDTYWRVGVGQFKTIEDAQQASQNLPEPYRDNYFVKRIQ